jgi:glutamate-ammonia-ligase adenylyltransferase
LIVQSLEASHGGRLTDVRERNTMRALDALAKHSLLSSTEYDALARAYVFLRDVENKLQMVHDAQTHSLPLADDELAACASLLGYKKAGGVAQLIERFEEDYRHHTASVSHLFEGDSWSSGFETIQPVNQEIRPSRIS